MSDVTRILLSIQAGDRAAADQLLPSIYQELRRLASQRMRGESEDHSLDATALVHEAYIRLVDTSQSQQWDSRGHFFAAAAEAMRRILIEQARRRQGPKAGGRHRRIELNSIEPEVARPDIDLLALDEALSRLERIDSRAAKLVKLRFFAGLTRTEAARVMGVSVATADNDWAYAKGWLRVAMSEAEGSAS